MHIILVAAEYHYGVKKKPGIMLEQLSKFGLLWALCRIAHFATGISIKFLDSFIGVFRQQFKPANFACIGLTVICFN